MTENRCNTTNSATHMLQDGRMIRGRNGDMIWRVELLTIISHDRIIQRSIKLKTIDVAS
jgi:hypothetical protein